ncbi:GNAT superfamily N-acetyltransferase [Massilia sp. MP_M2]|uniref:GNAT family N-acetyltransferase n=1 Tax=Massilia sp. MP_M2 TaxID=3071713 RepID=UPI00319DE838
MAHQLAAYTIRNLAPDEWPLYRTMRLRALQDAPDAFGSTLATESDRSPEEWAARLARAATSGIDHALAAEIAGQPVGLAWAKVDADAPALVNLFQMWVAPEARGQGVAAGLLTEAVRWARARGATAMQLGVNCANDAAVRLYARAGFVATGWREPMRPGSDQVEQRMRLVIAGS